MTWFWWLTAVVSCLHVCQADLSNSTHYHSHLQLSNSTHYHSHMQLTEFLLHINATYRHIAHLYSIGTSTQGRQLWVLALGESPRQHVTLRPEVKYVANIHGNEVVGGEMLIRLARHLVENYSILARVRRLLRTTNIHLLMSMNPDGVYSAHALNEQEVCRGSVGRRNFNDVDLNRNFPDYFEVNNVTREAETQALIDWIHQTQFVLSATLHGGALVACYPYDNYRRNASDYSPQHGRTRDDDVFRYLAKVYSEAHAHMAKAIPCEDTPDEIFDNGISNGASWYALKGGMQDYNYISAGCMELSLEIGCCKYPSASRLDRFWLDNREALIQYLLAVHIGVKGIVSDSSGQPVDGARVLIVGRDHPTNTTPSGEYWRLLLPGNYTVEVTAAGYSRSMQYFTVEPEAPTIVNLTLTSSRAASSLYMSGIPHAISVLVWSLCVVSSQIL